MSIEAAILLLAALIVGVATLFGRAAPAARGPTGDAPRAARGQDRHDPRSAASRVCRDGGQRVPALHLSASELSDASLPTVSHGRRPRCTTPRAGANTSGGEGLRRQGARSGHGVDLGRGYRRRSASSMLTSRATVMARNNGPTTDSRLARLRANGSTGTKSP